jgi:hypothetical protein
MVGLFTRGKVTRIMVQRSKAAESEKEREFYGGEVV